MARTINQILDEMLLEKQTMATLSTLQPNIDNTQTLLADLTTASKVAVWRLMFFVIAFGIWMHEKRFDDHVAWIEERALQLKIGSVQWYHARALEFQYGDALVLQADGEYQYAAVNEALRIVKLVSVNEIGGQLFLKVAKLDGAGTPEPLTTLELDAFIAYMQKLKFAGVIITCVSRVPDLLRVQYRVYVDPLVINANGELISNTSIKPIETAITDYCKGLPFNGVFSITELTDKIQQVEGVVNPVYENASAQYGINTFVALGDYYNPNAGYLTIDPAFPLSDSITYILA